MATESHRKHDPTLSNGLSFSNANRVKLVSTTVSKDNTTNQFGSPVAIIVVVLLAGTAVLQIFCLNKGPYLIVRRRGICTEAWGFMPVPST